MALSATKTWVAGEVLFASELNSEFSTIYTGGEDLSTPATKAHDMNGFELTLDGAGNSGILSDTANRIDLKLQGVDLFRFDGSAVSVANGLDLTASADGTDVTITAQGSTNVSIDIQPRGMGAVLVDGDPVGFLAARIFSL